jgi:hypothetical protein
MPNRIFTFDRYEKFNVVKTLFSGKFETIEVRAITKNSWITELTKIIENGKYIFFIKNFNTKIIPNHTKADKTPGIGRICYGNTTVDTGIGHVFVVKQVFMQVVLFIEY